MASRVLDSMYEQLGLSSTSTGTRFSELMKRMYLPNQPTLLFQAIERDKLEVVKFLVERNADVNER